MNEFELIARLTKSLPTNENVITGAGDDCAVLDLGVPENLILFKTDAVVEGIHFTRETPPEKIGRKALARCLSDIAAMAGTPTAALVTIALPEKFDRIHRQNLRWPERAGGKILRGDCRRRNDDESRTHLDFDCTARNRCRAENRFCVAARKSATRFL